MLDALAGTAELAADRHYPQGDVFDPASRAQFYYHAHRQAAEEHGHFHTFIRRDGIPLDFQPKRGGDDDAGAHLVAIGMNATGQPIELFSVNRWVTGEYWYPARNVAALLERFRFAGAPPHADLARWIEALLALFRPDVEALLIRRDARLAEWMLAHPGSDPYEDRRLEVVSALPVSTERQVRRVRRALNARS